MKEKDAIQRLDRQLGLIRELEGKSMDSPEFQKWKRDTDVAIKKIFTEQRHHLEFISIAYFRKPSWSDARVGITHTNAYSEGLQKAHVLLQSFIDEIKEYWSDEEAISKDQDMVEATEALTSDIFIVHGRDETGKQSVARLMEKLELKPIILHEQPNRGRTIIEKFEAYGKPAFSVVLLTPDDVGALETEKGVLQPRARQNVIFELGFFIGKIGRDRVCALHTGDVELPSDYSGILYISMDEAGAWELRLAKEIKASGIRVDLNKL